MLRRYYGGGSILAGVHRCFIVSYIRSSNLFFIAGVFPRLILCLFTLRFLAGVLRIQPRTRPAPIPYPALVVALVITASAPVVYVALSHGTVSPLSAAGAVRMRSRIARSKSACLALLASTRLALRLFSLRFNLHPSPQISYTSNKTCCGSYDISWRGTFPACNICVRIKRTISHETFPILPSQNLSLLDKHQPSGFSSLVP